MPVTVTTFAAVPLPLEPKGTPGHGFNTSDAFIVAGAAIGVALVLVVWLAFFRKKTEPEHKYPVPSKKHSSSEEPVQTTERRRRRKRRRVREHRPRNPTLDQTGGLPPPRPQDQPPPY
jgi:hypothetical protein